MALKDSDVYVHARRADGASDVVGRYRTVRSPGARPIGEFAYAPSWLRNEHRRAFALDPANLPLGSGTHVTRKRLALHGPLADATPDRWGRRIVEATSGSGDLPLSPSGWLLVTGNDRVGCLAFSSTPRMEDSRTSHAGILDLPAIAAAFDRLQAGKTTDPLTEGLFRAGRSLGGARPKTSVIYNDSTWVAKFQKVDDEYDQCTVEHATMRLAEACSIEVPETRVERVGPRRVLLVKRFDRGGGPNFNPNAHYLSGLSALNGDEVDESGSYADLADFLRRYGSDHGFDRAQLFRRMAFNVLCGNRDDHLKNHAFLMREGKWRLSPAFDIVPQPTMEAVQTIGVGKLGGTPTIANCMSCAGAFGLTNETANGMIDSLVETMSNWRTFFRGFEIDDRTIRALEPAFVLLPRRI